MRVVNNQIVRGLFIFDGSLYCFDAYSWYNSNENDNPRQQHSSWVDNLLK